jgi:hypothetical protein
VVGKFEREGEVIRIQLTQLIEELTVWCILRRIELRALGIRNIGKVTDIKIPHFGEFVQAGNVVSRNPDSFLLSEWRAVSKRPV